MPNALQYVLRNDPRYQTGLRETENGQTNAFDQYLNQLPMSQDYWSGVGFGGRLKDGGDPDLNRPGNEDMIQQWLQANGYQMGTDLPNAQNALVNGQGDVVPGSQYSVDDTGDFARDALLVAGGGYLGGTALSGGFAGGAAGLEGALPATLEAGGGFGSGAVGADAAAGLVGGGVGPGAALAAPGSVAAGGGASGLAGGAAGAAGGFGGLGSLGGAASAGLSGWGGAVQAAAPLVSGLIQSGQVNSAADQARAASDAAIAEQRRQFDLTRGDFAPYRQAGVDALGQLSGQANTPMSADEAAADPGYAWSQQQGQQGIDRKIAASGGRVSGNAIKAASEFNAGNASQFYGAANARRNERLNRLATIAGIAQTATSSGAGFGQQTANNVSGYMQNQGNNAAGATMAQGNIWGNAVNQLGALYGRYTPPGG